MTTVSIKRPPSFSGLVRNNHVVESQKVVKTEKQAGKVAKTFTEYHCEHVDGEVISSFSSAILLDKVQEVHGEFVSVSALYDRLRHGEFIRGLKMSKIERDAEDKQHLLNLSKETGEPCYRLDDNGVITYIKTITGVKHKLNELYPKAGGTADKIASADYIQKAVKKGQYEHSLGFSVTELK